MAQDVQEVQDWFGARGWKVFPFQKAVWKAALAGQSGLLHANTGAGKTYAVWFAALLRGALAGQRKASGLRVLWITPMRALAADTQRALEESSAVLAPAWRIGARTGDTGSAERARQSRAMPTALITTPESLSLLLSHAGAREQFGALDMIIVDEWHELMGSKRGVQVQLALARLRQWRPELVVWGLSATMGNLAQARDVLLGGAPGVLVEGGLRKQIAVDCLIPANVSRFPWGGHLGIAMLGPVIDEIERFNATLVFTNTRSQSELWYQNILEARPDWAGVIALHHGSLDREVREWVELGLKKGELKAVICTASLDLGVDFLPVERVLQIGSAKGIARLLQRAGRSGHAPGRVSRVTLVPTHSLELLEAAGARQAVAARRIEARLVPNKPFDVLVQHLVTVALGGGFRAEAMLAEVRAAWSYRGLTDEEWQWALDFVARGGQSLVAYPEYQRVVADEDGVYRVPNAALGRRHRMGIGTIVSDATMQVKYLSGGRIGSVEESFIGRLKAGDHFLFGGRILEFIRVNEMTAFVKRATGARGAVTALAGRQDADVVRAGPRRARAAAPGGAGPLRGAGDAGHQTAARDPAALVGAAHHRHPGRRKHGQPRGLPPVRVSVRGPLGAHGPGVAVRLSHRAPAADHVLDRDQRLRLRAALGRGGGLGARVRRGRWRSGRRRLRRNHRPSLWRGGAAVVHRPAARGRARQPERDPAVAAALSRGGAHRRSRVPGLPGPAEKHAPGASLVVAVLRGVPQTRQRQPAVDPGAARGARTGARAHAPA